MRIILSLICFFSISVQFYARDSVGLVLSGGGAKGIAHIGVIQALEDNEIPIDYITGTSMGAIVGGLYAIGYSPAEMLELFYSKDFYQAYSGDLSDIPGYNFQKPDATPDFLDFNLTVKSFREMAIGIRGFALVNPAALNFKFFELFTPSSVLAENDFDKLFVPFRCTGSDIYKKESIIFDKGNLAKAIQVSMSIPFYFRPLENEENKILIDGGIYDNLPTQPMEEIFNPDFIISSNVATSGKPQIINDDIGEFMTNIILQRNKYSVPAEKGLEIDVDMDPVGMMDFFKVNEAFNIGYQKGLEMVDSIRKYVSATVSPYELHHARQEYKKEIPVIAFQDIEIKGVNAKQKKFFEKVFTKNRHQIYTLADFRQDYLNFLVGNKNIEIMPSVAYNDSTYSYSLILDIRISEAPHIALGGNISSLNANQLYVGLGLDRISTNSMMNKMDLYWGNFLNSVTLTSAIEADKRIPIRYELTGTVNYFRYCDPKQSFFEYSKPLFNQKEYFAKLKASTPAYRGNKIEASLGIGYLEDKYPISGNNEEEFSNMSTYTLVEGKIKLSKSNLNHKLYPTQGEKYAISAAYYTGKEDFNWTNQEASYISSYEDVHYFSLKADFEKYLRVNNSIQLKCLVDGLYSNKPDYSNYESTIIQASAFAPTPHSQISFNPDLRANKYLGIGFCPIIKINPSTHFRFENYLFMPIKPIQEDPQTESAIEGKLFSRNTYFSEVSFVFNLPILSINLFANYYTRAESNFNFGINVGYPIFNKRFSE